MFSVFPIVIPIFALIAAGWGLRRSGLMGSSAASELNRFVVYLALPALLFEIIAKSPLSAVWRPGFLGAFTAGCFVVFVPVFFIRRHATGHVADAAVDALAASYANTGFIGFPLAAAVFGASAAAPTLLATIVTVCVLFAVAIVIIESGLNGESGSRRSLPALVWSLLRNPLIAGPLLGAVFPLTGAALPVPVGRFTGLLAGAASPCALVGLGLFLGEKRAAVSVSNKTVAWLTIGKLLVQPAVTWWVATGCFHLPKDQTHQAVLLAALPAGTGPFMLAEYYGREAAVSSKVILVSTLVSVFSLTACLACVAA